MKPYVDYPEQVAVCFISSLNKAFSSYGDVNDGDAQYSLATYSSKPSSSKLNSSSEHSPSLSQSALTPNNIIQLENPLHDAMCMQHTEGTQLGDLRTKDLRMIEVVAVEIRDLLRRVTFKVFMRAQIPPSANVILARLMHIIKNKVTARYDSKQGLW